MKNTLITLILIILSTSVTYSQFSVSGADVSVSEGAILSVTGDAINSGKIENSGLFAVSGNWDNTQTYITSGGEFLLNGTSDQQVLNNGQDFGILTVNGSGAKILDDDAIVSSQLNLSEGIIEVPTTSFFTLQSGANTTVGTDNSHVSGVLYREGTGSLTFPIGKDGIYAPVELFVISGNEGGSGLEVTHDNSGASFDRTISRISDVRYWTLYSENIPEGTISLSYDDNYSLLELDNVAVAEAETSEGMYTSLEIGEEEPSFFNGVTSGLKISKKYFALAVQQGDLENVFYIPNTLSPYATNPEDQCLKFYGDLLSPEGFGFSVYNKWGDLVFTTSSLSEMLETGWDGKHMRSQEILPFGVYSYIYKGTTVGGETVDKNGTVMILR